MSSISTSVSLSMIAFYGSWSFRVFGCFLELKCSSRFENNTITPCLMMLWIMFDYHFLCVPLWDCPRLGISWGKFGCWPLFIFQAPVDEQGTWQRLLCFFGQRLPHWFHLHFPGLISKEPKHGEQRYFGISNDFEKT